jgi:hypothetical protein
MKEGKSCMAWLIVIFIIAPGSIFLINLLFFSGNKNAEKYVDAYISDSKAIELDMVNDRGNSDFKTVSIYTGLKTAFLKVKLTGKRMHNFIFYNTKYQKYFSMSIIEEQRMQFDAYCAFNDRTIIAQINNYEMENASYGTRDNPIHIFMLEIPGVKHPDFLKNLISEDQYRRTVLVYLTYVMPKKEFKERYKK